MYIHEISTILPFEPLDFVTAVKWAQEKEKRSMVFSHWSDVPPENMSELLPLCEFESSEVIIEERKGALIYVLFTLSHLTQRQKEQYKIFLSFNNWFISWIFSYTF